jgi:ADP-heptose:LPS heptosyltransferase
MGLLGKECICINMSAGSSSRYWGQERFTSLIQELQAAFPMKHITVIAAPDDADKAAIIAQNAAGATALPSTRSFSEFAALLRSMTCIVTPDTAVVHLAAAFHIPCVAMFIQTDPTLKIWHPYNSPHRSLVSSQNSLRSISVSDVLDATRSIVHEQPHAFRRSPVKKR